MYLRIVFLFCITAVLALHLSDTPEDLKEFFKTVEDRVKSHYDSTKNNIGRRIVPLGYYVSEARTNLYQNLTHAATPYWSIIKSLQADAVEKGLNITDCINKGNNQIYALNNTVVGEVNSWINYYNQSGYDIISYSSVQAYSVLDELQALKEVVALCNEDTCATELKKAVTQFDVRANNTLVDAETKATSYVVDYLPVLLKLHSLDTDAYVANYTKFLHDITDCIGNTMTLY